MAYLDKYRLSRQLQTVKTVADCKDSCRLSKQLKTLKTVTESEENCKLFEAIVGSSLGGTMTMGSPSGKCHSKLIN